MARERDEGRSAEYGWRPGDPGRVPGGCSWTGETIARRWGYQEDGGCYVEPSGRHVSHCWNTMPDGSILDATADQFGESGDGIRVAPADDRRYLGTCDCGGDDQ